MGNLFQSFICRTSIREAAMLRHQLAICSDELNFLEMTLAALSPKLPTGFPVLTLEYSELRQSLDALGLIWINKEQFTPDMLIRYTDEVSWKLIVPHLISPADCYVAEGDDCDDYAKFASGKCSMLFGLNGCLEIWGDMPLGYHGFNAVVIAPGKFKLFEPNAGFEWAGELFDAQEHGYMPEAWR